MGRRGSPLVTLGEISSLPDLLSRQTRVPRHSCTSCMVRGNFRHIAAPSGAPADGLRRKDHKVVRGRVTCRGSRGGFLSRRQFCSRGAKLMFLKEKELCLALLSVGIGPLLMWPTISVLDLGV
jgi:hypothetical protein